MNPTTPNKSEGAEWEREFEEKFVAFTFNNGGALELTLWDVVDERIHPTDEVGTVLYEFIAHQRQQAVAEFAREVLAILDGHKVDEGISFEGDLPPADAMIAMMEEAETIRHAVNTIFDMAAADIHTIAKEHGIELN